MLTRVRSAGYRIAKSQRRPIQRLLVLAFRMLPLTWGLAAVVGVRITLSRRAGDFLGQAYMTVAARALRLDPGRRLSGPLTDHWPVPTADVLLRVRAYREAVRVIARSSLILQSDDAALLQALAFFELAQFDAMTESLAVRDDTGAARHAWILQQKAFCELLAGREREAVSRYLAPLADLRPDTWCPHQNMAARAPSSYVPTDTDLASGADGLLYDAYNFLGQRVTHVGRGDLGAGLYASALAAQARLRAQAPPVSPALAQWLAKHAVDPATMYIAPWEWTTQIGHLGMLDVLLRMRALGWWSGTLVILAHRERKSIANHAFLGLFATLPGVVIAGPGLPRTIDAELFALQRYYGLAFNAWKHPDGEVVPWQEAGAIAMRQWEAERRPLPLRDALDARYLSLALARESVERIRARWGMKPGDWYVCLHMRDPDFYGEAAGSGQTHRNSNVKDYLDAVRYVIEKGGWVVKLGGPKSYRLPRHPRIVDYARSRYKSELLDLLLIRQARMFVGTTSGLTNVAISFGLPCALVNCITTDAQLWSANVRFVPKAIVRTAGPMLSQHELTTTPWRWRMFSAELLRRDGAIQRENSADEILETLREVESVVDGRIDAYAQRFPDADRLLSRWRECLGLPHFYGAARPSLHFLQKYRGEFLGL